MQKSLKNNLILILAAITVGLLIGAIDTLFGRVLITLSDFRDSHYFATLPFLALAGLVSVWLYQRFGGKSSRGMSLIFEVGQGKGNYIPKVLVPLIMLTTWLTHLFGGSAGREGVAVQIGATVSHWLGKQLPVKDGSRIFLVTGMAAGFAGLFQTPLAATFFALEVLVIGELTVAALLPALLASLVASQTSHVLGLEKFAAPLSVDLDLTPVLILKLCLLGLCFGVVGTAFAAGLAWAKRQAAVYFNNPYIRIALIGLTVTGLLLLFWQGRYAGLGTNLISLSLDGGNIYIWDWLLKFVLTLLTLTAGFQGGEVTPLFAIGASLGVVLASLFGLPPVFVAGLGYAAVFGSATNTLLAPMFIGGEVFGFANMPYFVIVSALAFLVNHKYGIYALQKR
ncbi:chloride channel protein [Streptococcus dentasini]